MNEFHFEEGSFELLSLCDNLWELFITNQAENAGEMSFGVEEYIRGLRDGGLVKKAKDGKLYVQLVYVDEKQEPIGFCITSLTKDKAGEIEAIYVCDRYQGNKLGGRLLQKAMVWMEQEQAIEQRLVVATGNEKVIGFYTKYGFFPGYTTLFRVE